MYIMSNNLFYPQCLLTVKAFTVQMINHHIKQGEKYIMKLLNLKKWSFITILLMLKLGNFTFKNIKIKKLKTGFKIRKYECHGNLIVFFLSLIFFLGNIYIYILWLD